MAGVYKRESDRERGKAGRYTCWWKGADGKTHTCIGTTDKGVSERIAREREQEARLIVEGLVDPSERKRREASLKTVASHVEDYRLDILARGKTAGHARHIAGALRRLLDDAGIASVAELDVDRIVSALGRLKARGRSARTCNHALAAVKAFAGWLADANRIAEPPRGLRKVEKQSEESDPRYVRRALTVAEVGRLLAAAESGRTLDREAPKVPRVKGRRGGWGQKGRGRKVAITGPDRAALYRVAMASGFRANELRSLTVACFKLDGAEPAIALAPKDEKARRGVVQPITPELAESIRPYLAGKPDDAPALVVPEKTAELLRIDLAAAGIPYKTPDGIADFHALRAAYITHLIESGANPKVVKVLARHSSIELTMRYVKTTEAGIRDALGRSGK